MVYFINSLLIDSIVWEYTMLVFLEIECYMQWDPGIHHLGDCSAFWKCDPAVTVAIGISTCELSFEWQWHLARLYFRDKLYCIADGWRMQMCFPGKLDIATFLVSNQTSEKLTCVPGRFIDWPYMQHYFSYEEWHVCENSGDDAYANQAVAMATWRMPLNLLLAVVGDSLLLSQMRGSHFELSWNPAVHLVTLELLTTSTNVHLREIIMIALQCPFTIKYMSLLVHLQGDLCLVSDEFPLQLRMTQSLIQDGLQAHSSRFSYFFTWGQENEITNNDNCMIVIWRRKFVCLCWSSKVWNLHAIAWGQAMFFLGVVLSYPVSWEI
jgi:hypothetical protein